MEYLIDLARTEQQSDFTVTVGDNGKCNNSGEESPPAVEGKNTQNQSQTLQKVKKHKDQHEMKLATYYDYHGTQRMWTAFSNYNFYRKLNCQRASGENNLTTFLHEEKSKHQRFNWKEFQVLFLQKPT